MKKKNAKKRNEKGGNILEIQMIVTEGRITIVEEDQGHVIVEDHVIEVMIECEEDQEVEIVGVEVDLAIVDPDLVIVPDVIDHDQDPETQNVGVNHVMKGVGEILHLKDENHLLEKENIALQAHLQVRVQVLHLRCHPMIKIVLPSEHQDLNQVENVLVQSPLLLTKNQPNP